MENLIRLLPAIKRARGFRLYDFRGRRYVDLYRAGGRALFGHKPNLLVNNLKQVLEKGLTADLPSVYEHRLIKSLRCLFPGYKTFLVAASQDLLLCWASEYLGRPVRLNSVSDPLLPAPDRDFAIASWRPFSGCDPEAELVIPFLPFGLGEAPAVLCVKKEFRPSSQPGPLSPLLLAGLLHALTLLARTALPAWCKPTLFSPSPIFEQKTLYLVPRCPVHEYEGIFRSFLENGFLLSPYYPAASILPFELSEGELSRLTTLVLNLKMENGDE